MFVCMYVYLQKWLQQLFDVRGAVYDFVEQLQLENKDHWPTQELCQSTADHTHAHVRNAYFDLYVCR